jgi:uncharacterized protein YggE
MVNKKWLWAIGAGLVIPIVVFSGCAASPKAVTNPEPIKIVSQQEGIWVTGTGKMTVNPDIATVNLGVESQEATVAEAQAKASEAMDKVMTALKGAGIADKDIQTAYFNISPVTYWDDQKQQQITVGYQVSNTVTAKIRDLSSVGSVIDAVVAAGGDLTRINSLSYSLDDPTIYNKDLREKAMADAKSTAEQIAQLAGVKLGQPTYITESSYTPSPIYYRDFATAGGAPVPAPVIETPTSPGQMEISLNVQVAYSIQ